MWLWRNPDNVTHRQLLSIDQVWRRSTALTWSRWGCRRLADNIRLLAHDNNNIEAKDYESGGDNWTTGAYHNIKSTAVIFVVIKQSFRLAQGYYTDKMHKTSVSWILKLFVSLYLELLQNEWVRILLLLAHLIKIRWVLVCWWWFD